MVVFCVAFILIIVITNEQYAMLYQVVEKVLIAESIVIDALSVNVLVVVASLIIYSATTAIVASMAYIPVVRLHTLVVIANDANH